MSRVAGKRKPGRLLKKLALAVGVFVIADVLCAQIAKHVVRDWDVTKAARLYRVPSDIYHHDLAKMVDTNAFWGALRYRLLTNSLGFRDKTNRVVPLASSRPRVLLMGDSFAEGLGFEYSKTFPGIIAKELSRVGIEVLNAAVQSYAPTIYYRKTRYLLEDVGLKFDGVVLFLDVGDIQDEADFYDLDEQERVTMDLERARNSTWALMSRWEPPLTDKVKHFLKFNSITLHFVDMLKDVLERAGRGENSGLPPMTGLAKALWTVEEQWFEEFGRRGLENARRRMDQLASLLRERSVGLTVVVYPWPDQVAQGDRESKQVIFWREWSAKTGARFVNLFPPFFRETADQALMKYFISSDVHYNEEGNRLIAREFLESWRPDKLRVWEPSSEEERGR